MSYTPDPLTPSRETQRSFARAMNERGIEDLPQNTCAYCPRCGEKFVPRFSGQIHCELCMDDMKRLSDING